MTSMSNSNTSIAGMCQSVRRTLSQNLNDELAFAGVDYVPESGVLTLRTSNKRIGPGTLLSWREATLYVVSVSTLNSTLEVMPGYDGGPDIAIPAGSPLRINPRFTDYTLFQAVSDAIREMSSPMNGLYFPLNITYPGSASDDFYPLPAGLNGVTKVLQVRERVGTSDWMRLSPSEFTVSLNPGNQHVRIFSNGQEYEVVYAVGLAQPAAFTDDAITDCGLHQTMIDIPVIGASSTLMYGQESRRVHQRAQGDPRRAEDVPITGATGAARDLRRLFQQRIDEEHARLMTQVSYRVG